MIWLDTESAHLLQLQFTPNRGHLRAKKVTDQHAEDRGVLHHVAAVQQLPFTTWSCNGWADSLSNPVRAFMYTIDHSRGGRTVQYTFPSHSCPTNFQFSCWEWTSLPKDFTSKSFDPTICLSGVLGWLSFPLAVFLFQQTIGKALSLLGYNLGRGSLTPQ